MSEPRTIPLADRISALVEAAPIAKPKLFAEAALPLLMEANNDIAALVEAIDSMHNWAMETPQHSAARTALYTLAREMGGRKF